MDRNKLKLLYHTLKYLKAKQIVYRVYYFIRNRFFKKEYFKKLSIQIKPLVWGNDILNSESFTREYKFCFLNISNQFNQEIDWNYNLHGKLWAYNLNYFDFLNQENIPVNVGIDLIKKYINSDKKLIEGKEPYPISLRNINWIKFLSRNKINDELINQFMYNHYQILIDNLEYHLLGNHLLENGFSLFFGAYYFKDEDLYKKGKKLLFNELKEQILLDGGHFELSPMYHQILLHRLLDCINLGKNNSWKSDDLLLFLEGNALKMLSWLEQVTFKNGNIPMVNDSTYNIAASSKKLFKYAKKIELNWEDIKLSDSGYRMFKSNLFELFVDVGDVGPKYQPGHVHSDTFNFELYVKNNPILVDTGTSTYEKNSIRQKQRETASHNTIKIGSQEQTNVWGGFRVAKRAKIVDMEEGDDFITASHNGYKNKGVLHTRKFEIKDSCISIHDRISKNIEDSQVAFFHFHPNVGDLVIFENKINLQESHIKIDFGESVLKIEHETYEYALGFNNTVTAKKVKVYFSTYLETNIHI